MSTPAVIGYKREDGKIESIYVHWDGYLAYTGQILKHRYLGKQKIEALMNMGDLSMLGYNPEENPVGWDYNAVQDKAVSDSYCVSYRARGNKDCDKVVHENEDDFINHVTSSVPFVYLFKDGKWYYQYGGDNWKEV